MARTHSPASHRYDDDVRTRFQHCVDAPAPPLGFGSHLNEMLIWCVEHFEADTWAQHGRRERRKGKVPQDYARFYFETAADAEAFRQRWGGS
jgi:hypothetical protein